MSSALCPGLRRRTVLRGGLLAGLLAAAAAQTACSAGARAVVRFRGRRPHTHGQRHGRHERERVRAL